MPLSETDHFNEILKAMRCDAIEDETGNSNRGFLGFARNDKAKGEEQRQVQKQVLPLLGKMTSFVVIRFAEG